MLGNYQDASRGFADVLRLPSTGDTTNFGITCVSCHDPHAGDWDYQLRNPVFSTNFFTFFTGTATTNLYFTNFLGVITTNTYPANTVFASQYDPQLQVCAQCHNSRGARWQDTSRPPHHSPQYNILIGAVQTNYLNGTASMPGIYGLNTNGCAQCHVHKVVSPGTISDTNPVMTGHTFAPSLQGMVDAGWYASTNAAAAAIARIQTATTNQITALVAALNNWGLTKAPAVLRTNYGALAWEYSAAGALGNPSGSTNSIANGPPGSQQGLIPNPIKQARFNLYLVFHDQSLGVHNTNYAGFLLNDASNKVWAASQ
jgi:hypothetical protein